MPKRKHERTAYESDLFTIKDIDLEFESGKTKKYQIVEKSDGIMVVPITNDNELILIREYHAAIDETHLGLVKGRVEEDLTPQENANKELQEEVGYKAHTMHELGVLTVSPGYLTQKTHIFLAQDLEESKLDGDEEEEMEIVLHPFDRFEELIEQKKIVEARMIAALFLAKKFLNNP